MIGKGPEQVVLSESHDILEYADKKIDNEENRLYPSDPELLQLVQSWGMFRRSLCSSSFTRDHCDMGVVVEYEFIVTH